MISLLFTLALAQEPTRFDVIQMEMQKGRNCPELLEKSMKASASKNSEIQDLKIRIQQLELELLRAKNK